MGWKGKCYCGKSKDAPFKTVEGLLLCDECIIGHIANKKKSEIKWYCAACTNRVSEPDTLCDSCKAKGRRVD